MRKLFTLLLAVAASVGISANDYGTCGPDLRWTYDSQTHELVIGGSGPMYDYSYHGAPWSPYREDITSVSFVEDVSIPNFPFVAPTEGAVTLVWYIANIDEMCDEVGYVFAGNYNNWNTADVEAMAHFEPIPGHIGWFKAVIPQVDGVDHLEGKPCALQKDGTFNSSWDNQWIGTEDHPCEIISGSAELVVEYNIESRLVCAADADVVYMKSYAFKTNPCVDVVYDQVTFNLTVEVPVADGGTVYIVGDAFEKIWDNTAYPMTGSGSNWTITLPAIVGKSYKFCVNADWANDQMNFDSEKSCIVMAGNMKVDFTTMESTVYGFMNFGITEDQVCQEETIEGVMFIKCAGNGWIWTQMTVDPEDNTKFTYESTVADADHVGANIGVTNAAEGQWYDLGTADANGLAEGDAVVYTFVSTVGATGNLSIAKKGNTGYYAPIRNKKTESATPQITSIGAYAFSGCSGLTSVTIPNSVTSIGDGAFDGCRNLNTITNYATIPQPLDPDGISVFGGVPLTCTLYVLAESIALYQTADVWKDFGNILAIEESGEAEVLSIAEAIQIGMALDSMATSAETYTIEGYVINAGTFYAGTKYQNWYMADDQETAFSGFQAYKCYPIDGIDTVEVRNGSKVRMTGHLQKYYDRQKALYVVEMTYTPAIILSKPQIDTITVAEALALGAELEDNASTGKQYTIRGYVSSVSQYYEQLGDQDFYIADDPNSTANTNAAGGFYVYRGVPSTGTAVNKGDLVELTCAIRKYVPASGTNINIENSEFPISVTVLQTASDTCIVASGTCGNRLTWELSCDSVLTISGTGAMTSYSSDTIVPWSSYRTSIASVVVGEGITRIANYSFQACENLRSVTLPTSVTEIRDFSFSGCTSLISIEIPNSVTRISSNAFWDCDALTSIDIPYSVTNIQDKVFRGCNSLNSINVDSENPNYTSVDGVLFNKEATELIQYPAGKNNTSYSIPNSVTSIGTYAFYDCNNLTSIEIPNSVTLIGWGAFCGCEGLTSITVPNTVTSIGTTAFSYCYNLTTVTLPDSITSISMALFEYSNRLTSVIIPDGVTSIGYQAFLACSGLTSITIPNSVISIENYAFYGCRNLTAITNYAITPQTINTEVFSNFNKSTCTLYVPAESVDAYKAADVWKDFGNILPIGGTTPPEESDRAGQSTEGKDFWVTFLQADQDPNNDLVLSLSISSREDCQVMISNPYTGYMENIYVLADQPQKVELYSGNVLLANARTTMANSGKVCYAGYSEQVDTCALRVTATSDISLFATNYKRATFDATNVLPTALLGDEYFIQTYTPSDHAGVSSSQGSHFAIIATEDNTIVDYCPTVMTQAITDSVNVAQTKRDFMGEDALTEREKLWLHYTIGDTLHTPVLMAGQVFYVWTGKKDGETGDLSGTYVKARNGKRIAVFQGNPHTNVPYQVKQRDQLYSQAMPVQSWGSTFALTASAERPSDIIRVMALYDGTEVRINGNLVHSFDFANYDKKQYWEFEIGPSGMYAQDGSCMLTTSQPVAVHLFLTSQRHHGDSQSNGDPAMLWVSPIEQQMEQVNFVTNDSRNGTISNYLNVVTDRPNSMTLDNISIASYFSPVSGSNTYHYAQIALGSTATAHTLKCNGGRFNAHVYGFTSNESYGYSVGGFIEDLTPYIYINGEQITSYTDNDLCVRDTLFMDITTSFDYQSMKLDFGDGTVVYATDEEGIHARHAYDAPGVYHANVVVASNNNRLDSIPIRIMAGPLSLTYEPLNDIYVGDSIFYIYYHSPIQEMQIEEDFTIERSFNDAALQDGFGHYTTRLNRSFFGIRIPEGARVGVEYAFNVDIHTLCGDYTATIPFVLKARRTGSCGDNLALTWTYDPETKTLTITGDGALNSNYTFGLEAPLEMEQLIIAEGVTSIGANAFSNMSTLQTMQLPASLQTIGASAFENDINLTAIYNYRERPCLVDATAFNGVNKFDCTLYVLEGSVDMYKSSISDWKDFYFILPIGTTEVTEPVSDVTVEPHDNTAVVTWPTTANAVTYTIEISKDGVVFCRLIFNAYGQLIGIAFAPGREGAHHAMAATMTTGGMQFTVTGLNSNTNYSYTVVVKDESEETISSYAGEFTTTGEDTPTGVEGIQPSEVSYRKLLRNGQIFILRGDKVYNAQGALVK